MSTPEVAFTTTRGQSVVTGVQGFSSAAAPTTPAPNTISPNAIRWLFNPFAHIDVRERPISGHDFLRAGMLIPITSQNDRKSKSGISSAPGKAFDWQNGNAPQAVGAATPAAPQGEYYNQTRTAFAIASEFEDAYSDRGVRILPSLTKFDDIAAVDALHKTLIADGLVYNTDPYQPEFPVPNLVILESYLQKEAMKNAASINGDLAIKPTEVVSDLLVSVRTALQLCRETTRTAKRVVANKTVGYVHAFDAWQSRCFIALGEQVPSDLPFVSDSGHMTAAGVGAPTGELERLRAENESLKAKAAQDEIDRLRAENERLRAPQEGWESHAKATNQPVTSTVETAEASAEKIAVQCTANTASGEQCKRQGNPETGRCPSHPLETQIKESQDNA